MISRTTMTWLAGALVLCGATGALAASEEAPFDTSAQIGSNPKLPEPQAKPAALPGIKESVTLRLDQDVLDFFREDGPGWQERINAALRRLIEDSRR